MKKIIKIGIWVFILALITFGIYKGFIKEEQEVFILAEVIRGDVYQEILETGIIATGDILNLNFKIGGKIKEIFINEGQSIKKGDILAKLEVEHLKNQLEEMEIGLELANSQFTGAEITLIIAEQNLKNIETLGKTQLNQAYKSALSLLKGSNLIIGDIFNTVDLFQRTYFIRNNQDGIRVRNQERRIGEVQETIEYYLNIAKNNPTQENISRTLLEAEKGFNIILEALADIKNIIGQERYRNTILLTDKAVLDLKEINTSKKIISIVGVQQSVLSIKTKNQININLAKLQILAAENKKENVLLLTLTSKARINSLENKIEEAVIYSPIDGIIVKVNKSVGEIFQPMMTFISIIPVGYFQVEAYIFEEDIVKIEIGDIVEVNLIAFPDEQLEGEVYSIDFTEKMIGGVVHYLIIINFEEIKIEKEKEIRVGMTADIVIKTEIREDVLIIDENAIQRQDGKFIVQVYKDNLIEKREVKIGLRGEDNMVEVVFGLSQGEIIIQK